MEDKKHILDKISDSENYELNRLLDIEADYNYGFEPVESQLRFLEALFDPQYKEVVLDAGRSWGKDLVLGMFIDYYLKTNKNKKISFITPVYNQVDKFFRQVINGVNGETGRYFIPHGHHNYPIFKINETKKILKYIDTNSELIGMSAEKPENIRGDRADIIILNEAAFIDKNTIDTQVYAVIKKYAPKIIWVSTPNGRNHFFNKFQEGCHDPKSPYYDKAKEKSSVISFKFTYEQNEKSALPVEMMRESLPSRVFEQEVMAEFLEDTSVFKNLKQAIFPVELDPEETICNSWAIPPVKDHRYVAGLDLARENDWTVLFIKDVESGKIVRYERLTRIDYVTQVLRILEITKEYNSAPILFDATGVGTAVSDILYEYNKNDDQAINGLVFTNDRKAELINKLSIRIERDKGWIPDLPIVLQELRNLKIQRTSLGKATYAAPEGEHDDCVMALALCNMLYFEEMNLNVILKS